MLGTLCSTVIPSPDVEEFLKYSSTHVGCGIISWHQAKFYKVYQRWCDKLWLECLRGNGFAPDVSATEVGLMSNREDEIRRLRNRDFPKGELYDDACTTDEDSLDRNSNDDEDGESLEIIENPLTQLDSDDD